MKVSRIESSWERISRLYTSWRHLGADNGSDSFFVLFLEPETLQNWLQTSRFPKFLKREKWIWLFGCWAERGSDREYRFSKWSMDQKSICAQLNGFVWVQSKRVLKNTNRFFLQLVHKFVTRAMDHLNHAWVWRAKSGIQKWDYRPLNHLVTTKWDPLKAHSKDSGLCARSLSPATVFKLYKNAHFSQQSEILQ